ncbi:hypothetical protein ACFR9U_20590 [Halorientalis brevis]|uniref:Uncharacterized protein n=1 Tax=Halorientalis brevis TaxID=1126241 RepID=A0ABD6CGM0_9EURY|nr:hypothetical protein [Halorientalis brevis]
MGDASDVSTGDADSVSDAGDKEGASDASGVSGEPPRLLSRVLVTWIELTVVGITGGLAGATVGGPPGFIIYLLTTLVSIGVLFYNVDALITRRMRAARFG